MAWNPSPEVAAARDFGNKFNAKQVIILYITETPQGDAIAYASYGKTRKLCDGAVPIADAAFDAACEVMSNAR